MTFLFSRADIMAALMMGVSSWLGLLSALVSAPNETILKNISNGVVEGGIWTRREEVLLQTYPH